MRLTCFTALLFASCGLDFGSTPVPPADGSDDALDGTEAFDGPEGDDMDGRDPAVDPPLDSLEELEGPEADGDLEEEPGNRPPTVSITAPSSGTLVQAGDSIDITVEAADADGTVDGIDLYRDGTWVAGSNEASLLWTWDTADPGSFIFHASAYDDGGAAAESENVEIKVFHTLSFQDGLYPDDTYAGTADTNLEAVAPTQTYGTATDLEADGVDVGDDAVALLIRWDVSIIPSDAEILDARLVIFPRSTTSASDTYQVYAMLRAWEEMEATWLEAETGSPWEVEGCLGDLDHDHVVLGTVAENASPTIVMDATPDFLETVRHWVASPSENFGIVAQDYTQTDGMHVNSREVWDTSLHPLLEITCVP